PAAARRMAIPPRRFWNSTATACSCARSARTSTPGRLRIPCASTRTTTSGRPTRALTWWSSSTRKAGSRWCSDANRKPPISTRIRTSATPIRRSLADDARFREPHVVTGDPQDNIYISEGTVNPRGAKYNKNGDWVNSWGHRGKGPGEFTLVHTIPADAQGNIYVGDRNNRRIQV